MEMRSKHAVNCKVYELYDNGCYVMTAPGIEIKEKLGMSSNISLKKYYLDNHRYRRRYTFIPTGETVKVTLEKVMSDRNRRNSERKRDYGKTLEYLYRHLRDTKVTCLSTDPGEYLECLEQMLGCKIQVKEAYDRNDAGKKIGIYWVLEI